MTVLEPRKQEPADDGDGAASTGQMYPLQRQVLTGIRATKDLN